MLGRPASLLIDGPAGHIEVVVEDPASAPRGLAVIAHPHPLMGGTMDNKVVHTLVRAFVLAGWRAVRFNFRGVGQSEGQYDEGRGEAADLLAVVAHHLSDPALAGRPLALAGFSFGGYVAAQAASRLLQVAADQLLGARRHLGRGQVGGLLRPRGLVAQRQRPKEGTRITCAIDEAVGVIVEAAGRQLGRAIAHKAIDEYVVEDLPRAIDAAHEALASVACAVRADIRLIRREGHGQTTLQATKNLGVDANGHAGHLELELAGIGCL